ncbi:unnamed protein product [Cyclocybe aegerita]|uniref:Mediator of RNA polymerase II transcription subunit 12 n=1 Tax=Cyclocybe aegerita TaxID=1973307 RepID=A0A8S0W6J4_CYCAE|nr:unnamed protein product [Cyclocybe aegerita]
MREKKDEKQAAALPVYELHPPGWLPKIHGEADLGYPGFHPPRPGQDEDVLSETNIKNGFILSQPVSVETFSAQTMINEKLHSYETLSKLEELMNEVFIRRADRILPIPASTFRIPTRVTLNDVKRNAWFADLANPNVPLSKLGKSVPHGAKGHDLLDMLQTNKVAIQRAVWFVRVFGANETAAFRNKAGYLPTQYSVDWAGLVTSYMKKQLLEIALPSAPRPGLNIKQTFKGVLADSDTREKWIGRFSYTLKLLRAFYEEDLVDHRFFLTWLVQQMVTCNLAQAGFLTRLLDEFLDDVVTSRALSKPLVEACLGKLSEIRTSSAHEFLKETEELLQVLIQRLCLTIPNAFISPKMWNAYWSLIEEVLLDSSIKHTNDRCISQNVQELRYILSESLHDLRTRNEAISFRGPIAHVSARLSTAVSDVKLLNSISSDTDMGSINYFSQDTNDFLSFKEKLDMLLSWSVTPFQYGDHRPFAAVTLIRLWRDRACDRASRRDVATPSEFLQDQLFDWLDTSEVGGEAGNIRDVALLYGKLVKHEVFSYASYIQRLIARGEQGLSFKETPGSRHRFFLTWIPLFNATSSLANQRKVTLYGARAREIPEDETERKIRSEVRAVMPDLFEVPSQATWTSTSTLLEQCKTLIMATRFEQVRTFRQWLLPFFKQRITKRPKVDQTVLFKSYLVATELMASAKCFHSVLDLTLYMLEHATDAETMNGLIGTFYRYAAIWTCMDTVPTIVKALDVAHQLWKSRGIPSRPLLALLMRFDNGRHLSQASRDRIVTDVTAFTQALQPLVDHPDSAPDVLPEILLLSGDPDPNAPTILANGLWIKYRTSLDWAWKVWDNTVASLRQIPSMSSDLEARRACALRYGNFLWRVDQHLPDGLDSDVLQWFLGPGRAEVAALSSDAWDVLKAVLLYLAVSGALRTTTILEGLVYPAWQLAANGSGQPLISETYLSAANSLCFHLLLQEDGSGDSMPPTNLFEVQCIRTRRQAVYDEPHFSFLASNIPALICLESNQEIPEALRAESTTLRCQLCQQSGFRQGAYRNLDIIREAFENSPYLVDQDPSTENLSKRAIAGLNMILCDSTDDTNIYDWPEVTCLLSPWKIAATTIQMQLQVKQLGRALSHESTSEAAAANLNKLTTMLFHNTKTADEAYYVGEMARGADATVVTKFINNGFKSMIERFSDSSSNEECLRRVGDLLRVLIHVSQPLRETPNSIPTVETTIHESFLEAVDKGFQALDKAVTDSDIPPECRDNLVLLCRLLQFILSFKFTLTVHSRTLCTNISTIIFRLVLRSASEDHLNLDLYPILIDTLFITLDEIHDPKQNPEPHDTKHTPFRYYPSMLITDLPPHLPFEYRKQITTLLAQLPFDSVTTSLVNTHHDSQGNIVYGQPVINKPWEWIENLGEPSVTDPRDEEREREEKERLKTRYLVKNSGSISLDNFAARLTGDGVRQEMSSEEGSRLEACIHSFEDGLSESVFSRDFRETRGDWDRELSPDTLSRIRGELDPEALAVHEVSSKGQGMRTSPASSVISRSSASSGRRQQQHRSPSQTRASTSTAHDVIDVDSIPTNSSTRGTTKRKAAAVSDDEVEIVEGPVRATGSSKRQKASKAPTANKTKARKK